MAWAPPRSMCMFCAPGRPVRMLRAPAAQARDLPATRAQCADRGPAGPDMHALGALLLALQLATGAGSAEAGRFAGFGRMPAEPPSTAPALEYRASPSACLYPPMPSPAAKLGQHSARSPFTPTGIAEAARLLEEAWAARASGDYAQVLARATLQLPTPLLCTHRRAGRTRAGTGGVRPCGGLQRPRAGRPSAAGPRPAALPGTPEAGRAEGRG